MRHIVSFTFTLDNLPDSIAAGPDRSIAFCYTASGRKVRETTRSRHFVPHPLLPGNTNASNSLNPDATLNSPFLIFFDIQSYCDNLVYKILTDNHKLLIDGGYISFGVGGTPVYHFYQKDHLGNVRVVSDANGTVEEVNHYYPYGALMGESQNTTTQPYKYNGKELDRSFGLDWYDYGARWMDGVGGRWSSMDPLCEKYYDVSPYAYCAGNPMNRIDIDGRDDYELNKEGSLILVKVNNSKMDIIKYGNSQLQISHGAFGTTDSKKLNHDFSNQMLEFKNVKEGLSFMRFVSSYTGKELSGVGIKNNSTHKTVLRVSGWKNNGIGENSHGAIEYCKNEF